MKIVSSKTVCRLAPEQGNPRNSEGDFVRLPDGNILFAYSRFSSGSQDDAMSEIAGIVLSPDGEKVLSPEPFIIVHASEYDNVKNLMSVSLMPLLNGEIGLFFIVRRYDSPDEYGRIHSWLDLIMRRSADGLHFDASTDTLCTGPYKAYYVVNNNRVMRLRDNRLVFAAAQHRVGYNVRDEHYSACDGLAVAHVFMSEDDGKTWNESGYGIGMPSYAEGGAGLQEPGIYELPNGSLCLYARTSKGCQYTSFSPDGKLWSAASPSDFSSPLSPMKVARNPYSGKYYAVRNPIPRYETAEITAWGWGRTPLVISESTNGTVFDTPVPVEDDLAYGYCYPAVFFLNEKEMLLSYCSGGKDDGICLAATTVRKIKVE